ncbi:hypothetical protein Ocin01_13519 [Orchesella cincta]|uniref:Uncharacterized protein n=1 Tax=Orchesella cincta TaxID=48709 RepID=A0A1D2MJU0_ORCCI|nr:hypothetical protein Ocin01_13519 [Orchesella cincta]
MNVSVSLSMLDKPESRLVMPAGNSTVSSTESSPMAKCHLTRPSELVMIPSTPSSVKLELASTFPVLSSLTWSQL